MNKNELIKEIENVFQYKHILNNLILSNKYKQIIIIGNGGSNAIASHISQDYTKQLKKKAFSFSDPSRLTCYINDYGRDEAYVKFVEEFSMHVETLVICISSSGNSMNIYNVAKFCDDNSIDWISLTGFFKENKLYSFANNCNNNLLNVYVDSCDYGVVECVHEIFLHSILGKE